MPQNNVQPNWVATYPTDLKFQKPGTLTPPVSATLWAHAVPNKPQWTGTQVLSPGEPGYGTTNVVP